MFGNNQQINAKQWDWEMKTDLCFAELAFYNLNIDFRNASGI